MKEIVKITKGGTGKTIITLITLREKLLKHQDIVMKPCGTFTRVHTDTYSNYMSDDSILKVVGIHMHQCLPATSIRKDNKLLLEEYEKGNIYVQLECNEDGYPILDSDSKLIIYGFYSSNTSITPQEALERIQQFNEEYTNNHKLTPGLHESS